MLSQPSLGLRLDANPSAQHARPPHRRLGIRSLAVDHFDHEVQVLGVRLAAAPNVRAAAGYGLPEPYTTFDTADA